MSKYPVTQAIRFLRAKKVKFVPHLFDYVEKGGTRHSAEMLGVSEHAVIKSIVFEASDGDPLIVLMHGDKEVSEKNLARLLEVKSVSPAGPEQARKWTGYEFGGTSPFGTARQIRVLAESSIFELDRIFINGGKRGFLVEIDPKALKETISPREIEAAI